MRAEYNKLTTDKVAKNLMRTKQTYYVWGKKPGKLLAWRLKKIQAERTINSIMTASGNLTLDPLEINATFRDFYESLYKSKYTNLEQQQEIFLDRLQFLMLSRDERETLDSMLMAEDLCDAISSMNSGKSPDGIPIEFYKKLKEKLKQPLLNMFHESYKQNSSIIIKTTHDSCDTKTRQITHQLFINITFIGCDVKILCKALSNRLEQFLPQLVSNDQNSFVLNRQGFDNIRRVLNVLFEKSNASLWFASKVWIRRNLP